MRNALVVSLSAAIIIGSIGCSTPYQRHGVRGGYSELQLDANTFKVQFSGNGYTARSRVETCLFYRCAELTDRDGI